jgi:hypothetical protein
MVTVEELYGFSVLELIEHDSPEEKKTDRGRFFLFSKRG